MPPMTIETESSALGRHYPDHVREIQSRHERALERAGASHAVIFAGAPRPVFLDDYNYPFKANPHFLSWVPLLSNPWSLVVCTPGEKPLLVYFQEKDYWHSPPADPTGFWTGEFDIRIVHTIADVAAQLPEDKDKCILIGEVQDETQSFGIERSNPKSNSRSLNGVSSAWSRASCSSSHDRYSPISELFVAKTASESRYSSPFVNT